MGVGRRGGAPGCRATAAGARLGGRWPAARSLSRPRWKVVPSGVPATRELEAVPVPVPRERLVEPLQSAIRQLGIAPDARNILAHDARGHPTRDTQHVQRLPLIDGLDEGWVEDRVRYKLIMALIVTARDFIQIESAKVIIALRRDLLDRVFRIARDSGFQEEKYRSLYLPPTWSKDDILTVLDKRISHLVARRYTKATLGYKEVFPRRFRGVPIGDYIYGIATRPRDVIAFFNLHYS